MKRRFPLGCWLALALALVAAGTSLWWFLIHHGSGDEKEAPEAASTAQVQVARLRSGVIERTLSAYGTVAPSPGGTRSVAYPFESRVVAVQASIGQTVAAGDDLLQIEPSADARLALDTARSTQSAAESALQDVQARFKGHLATNADLAAAESAARDARLKFSSLQNRVPAADGLVKAPAAGVVTNLPAGPGAVVAPGGLLVVIAVEKRFEARLGVSPADAAEIKPGQTVELAAVESVGGASGGGAVWRGTVRVVGASVDPGTRLVDVLATLDDPSAPVLIGTYLRAKIVVETKQALLAPRAAVLPAEEGADRATLFTIHEGKAVEHEVRTGIDDGSWVEIASGDPALSAGVNVVTEGNYELDDHMPVQIGQDAASKEKAGGKGTGEGGDP